MTYAYMPGQSQPDEQIVIPRGRMIGGLAIGILALDGLDPLLPGNVDNATTFDFPVLYKIVYGVPPEQIFSAAPEALDPLIKAGRELEEQGVRAITGDCGWLGNYQKEMAAAMNVPVFLSSLLQIPFVSQSLKPGQKVGVLIANSAVLTPTLLSACGIDDPSIIVAAGIENLPESKNLKECTGRYNSFKMEQEQVSLAKQLIRENPNIGALLLECADMPTYAWSIQNAVKLPVFDFVTLLNWVYSGIVRRPFAGFM